MLGKKGRDMKDKEKNDIISLIQDAVDNMDFDNLSGNIQEKLESLGREAVNQVNDAVDVAHEAVRTSVTRTQVVEPSCEKTQSKTRYNHVGRGRNLIPGRILRNPGLYSGPVLSVLGAFGLLTFGGLALAILISGIVEGMVNTALASVVMLPFVFVSGLVFGIGFRSGKRAGRIREYAALWRGQSYIMIEELAERCRREPEKVTKDIRFLLERSLLPGAVLDRQETCLMLTDEARKQYEDAVDAQRIREQEEEERRKQEEAVLNASPEERKIHRIKKEGQEYLSQISALRKEIASLQVCQELEKMELTAARIFVCAAEHPESASVTDRLFQYYLPSVVKLIDVYEEIEDQPIQGENITKTKTEIENSLATMNQALEKMYDEMFQDVAMDISSDISVLELMLKQDGFSEQELHADKGSGLW